VNRRAPLAPGLLTAMLGLLVTAAPAIASDPASQDGSVPTAPGETVELTWTGIIPPGSNDASDCTAGPRELSDIHTVELAVPAGTYDVVNVNVAVTIEATGLGADGFDLITTVIRPDGTATSADGGFVGTPETVGLSNPQPGTYEVLACAFAGALPQSYEGAMTMTAEPKIPQVAEAYCAPPSGTPKFEMGYIDESRAGGEPLITVHPNGDLLWGSHAGTTHFYSPAAASPTSGAFVENYEGQTYQYYLDDEAGWVFVPRQGPGDGDVAPVAGQPASGFSDPEFAIDQAGNVFISEINLANVAVSKSTDGGRSYGLQNTFAFTQSDRQWMAADAEDELYMTANGFGGGPFPNEPAGYLNHFMSKSTDGGITWNGASQTHTDGVGDIQIDHERGIMYEMSATTSGFLGIARFPNIREESTDFTAEVFEIASQVGMSGVQRLIDPTFDLDDQGNVYATWSDNGDGLRPAGIYYSHSTDQGETWALPTRVDPDDNGDAWPWITAGAPGQVAVTWLQSNEVPTGPLPGEDQSGEAQWHVTVATTSTGLGCAGAEGAGFTLTTASSEPVHTGTICQGGTVCQAELVDRRLGDYFSIVADLDGFIHVAVSDTRQGGAIALPLHIRQVSGATLDGAPDPVQTDPPQPAPEPDPLPATGAGLALLGLGLALTASALRRRAT